MGRSLSDEHLSPPAKRLVSSVVVVAPDYTNTNLRLLSQSDEDAHYLKCRLRSTVVSPSESSTVTGVIKARQPRLSVRGEPAFKMTFAKRMPFVCHAWWPGWFRTDFLWMFASDFIAQLWSVHNSLVYEVAQELYDTAIPDDGPPMPVAEVLRH